MLRGINLISLLLTADVAPLNAHRAKYRVMQTIPNTKGEYPYIIALLSHDYRTGTGTLLTQRWVLTCAHCLDDTTHIQYGDMSIPAEFSTTKSKVIKALKYPGYKTGELLNEIGICKVKSVPIKIFGKLSNIEYNALVGQTVIYAGYGTSQYSDEAGGQGPLQVSEAVVALCEDNHSNDLYLCLRFDKVDIKYQDLTESYTGGPVFSYGDIVGIVSYGIIDIPPGYITAILPYKTWIYSVVSGRIE